jgi:hypothetical protein
MSRVEARGSILVVVQDMIPCARCGDASTFRPLCGECRGLGVVADPQRSALHHHGHNLVTDAGELYLSQKATGAAPTNVFGIMELGTAGNAPAAASTRADLTTKIASSQKAFTATYPKVNDLDADNTGKGASVMTWLTTYATTDFDHAAVDIDRSIITNTAPAAGEPLFDYGTFTAFGKSSVQQAKCFVNVTLAGV